MAIFAFCADWVSCCSLGSAPWQMLLYSPEALPHDPVATVTFPPDTVMVTVTVS